MAGSSSKAATRTATRSPESYDSFSRRNAAAQILSKYEQLSWMAAQRCETITQTRMHMQRIVSGAIDLDSEDYIKWKEDFSPHPKAASTEHERSKGKGKMSSGEGSSKKGKERASISGGSDRKASKTVNEGASGSKSRGRTGANQTSKSASEPQSEDEASDAAEATAATITSDD